MIAGQEMHPIAGIGLALWWLRAACIALGAALLAVLATAAAGGESAWRDPVTGLAIGGYDPVGYFISGTAQRGRATHELVHGGVSWRFVNKGNHAAFAAAPQVYAPRYRGYDPVALADGHLSRGEPMIWSMQKGALYLFQNPVNRLRWREAPDRFREQADRTWPRLSRTLPSFAP